MIQSRTLLLTLLIGLLASPAALAALPAPDVWVDDDYDSNTPGWGVTHFATIQSGLSNVNPGGTVHIQSGVYLGTVQLSSPVILLGEGPTKPVLNSGSAAIGIVVSALDCKIQGLDIRGSTRSSIDVMSFRCHIEGNSFQGVQRAIEARDIFGLTVKGNEFTGCTDESLYAFNVKALVIQGNRDLNGSKGIYIQRCDDAVIEDNEVSGVSQTAIYLHGDRLIVRRNRVDNSGTGIEVSTTDGQVQNNRINACRFGILHQGRFGRINSNRLTEIDFIGITLRFETQAYDNRLSNTVSNPLSRGFSVDQPQASRVNVRHNLVIGFDVGVSMPFLSGSLAQVEFTENLIIGSGLAGFRHTGSTFHSPILTRNAVLSSQRGLYSETLTNSALAVENSFVDNQIGIQIDPASSGWRFHRNNFRNAVNAQVDGNAELYSLVPPFGNFWSDYGGIDGNGDGFGDTPYVAPGSAGATDQFPYIEPTGRSMLWSDSYATPAASPAPLTIHLEADSTYAGKTFLLLPSVTGLTPGLALPSGKTLPIAVDSLTSYVLTNLSAPLFSGFSGTLDAQGSATTTIALPPLPASFAGQIVFLAAIIGPPFVQPSNAMAVWLK